ncbi:MAG: rod shape-determining protein MreD [Ruminococcaceae bacterium]|nr:rod shape-determining protein MreD [Oscillospiraceae bacterium]
MNIKRKRFIAAFVNILLLAAAFMLRYSGVAVFNIGQAVPLILLPAALSISIFYSENIGLLTGFLTGVFIDSVSSDSSCFNTLFFTIGCAVCSVLSSRFLNRNLKAALCLSAGMSFLYFMLKYIIYFVFFGVSVNYDYFILYLIPSAVYTAVWVFPFYFLNKKLSSY